MPATLLASALLLLATACAGHARADTPADYLVQEVCDDGNGGHTSADPITCPGSARKLAVGEALPYHKYDNADPSAPNAQISDSFPIVDLSGQTRVVSTFFYENATYGLNANLGYVTPSFAPGAPSSGPAAYDIYIADGTYISAAGTYDDGAGWQPWWTSSTTCSFADSWTFAPKAADLPLSQGYYITDLSTLPQCPPAGFPFTSVLQVWNSYTHYPYESGKFLQTIKTWNFSGPTLDSAAFESFAFTKEYGKTRWEAWSSTATAPNPVAVAKCPTGTNQGVNVFSHTTYYLQDCHDWSNVAAPPDGDWQPIANWHVDPLYYSDNLLQNTHMECRDPSGQPGICAPPAYQCNYLGPWDRVSDTGATPTLNWGYDNDTQAGVATYNCALQISTPDAQAGQSLYQDAAVPSGGISSYSYGAALFLPGAQAGQTATATVAVFELSSSGAVVATHSIAASVTATPQFYSGAFDLSSQTASVRFQIYPGTPNVIYEVRDAWVARQPF